MGRTLRTQVAWYRDAEKVQMLDKLARHTGQIKQALLHQAIEVLLTD